MHNEQTTSIFKALADDTRLGIVRQLACDEEGQHCAKVRDSSSLSQPTISHHLSKLVEAGLVFESKQGKEKIYKLNKELFFAHGIDVDRI